MFKNYFKVALRNLVNQKTYSIITILGLATGMMCFMLIVLYVRYELSFDTFHEKTDRIFRIVQRQPGNVYLGQDYFGVTPMPLAPTLMKEYPEVLNAALIDNQDNALLIYEDKKFYESGLIVGEHFFDIFTFPLISGNKETALNELYSIVISQRLAQKFFGDKDPIGNTIKFVESYDVTVTGVAEDPPKNSHIQFDFLIAVKTHAASVEWYRNNTDNWGNNSYYTYFELQEGYPYKELEKKFPALLTKYKEEDEHSKHEHNQKYIIQPLKKIHLYSHVNFELSQNNDIKYIYLFLSIGFLILIIACINYMNLSTARSSKRALEIGIRKVVGAQRANLVWQFLGESIFLSFLALLIAVLLFVVLLPSFNSFLERSITIDFSQNLFFLTTLLGIVLFVGIFSGSYPALFLSTFKPVKVLKGIFISGSKNSILRNILVVGQFCISVILIAGTLVVYQQLQFVRNKKLGYNHEHVVTMRIRDGEARRNMETMKTELLKHSNIINVSCSDRLPAAISSQSTALLEGEDGEEKQLPIYIAHVDYDFLDVYEIELLFGRNFSREFSTDTSNAVIVNQTTYEQMGWGEPVGKNFSVWSVRDGQVIGVVKDFHFQSLHLKIEPAVLILRPARANYISARIRGDNISETVGFIRKTFEKYSLNHPFEYSFFDETFYRMYKAEQRLGEIFRYFSLLAIFIACLGLFGLASFMVENQRKAIGIRKVLGASTSRIVYIFSKEFSKLVLIANVIAWPVAYFAMSRWLEDFAYRISIGVWVFILSAIIAFVIALVTVGYHAVKAAVANPVDSLRYE